jgi:hypothetical protein
MSVLRQSLPPSEVDVNDRTLIHTLHFCTADHPKRHYCIVYMQICCLAGDHLQFRVFHLGKYGRNVLFMSKICAKEMKFILLPLS